MTHFKLCYFKFAVVLTTAFFLHGQSDNKVVYLHGKVEKINTNLEGANSISSLEVNSTVSTNEIIASAKGSRIEFKSRDQILRLGSLSVCRFPTPSKIWIHSGSLLFSSTKEANFEFSSIKSNLEFEGIGTYILEATSNGGFKFIPIEGSGSITTKSGVTKKIKSGRMTLVLGNPSVFGDAYDIDLMLMIKSSRLINAFPKPLERMRHIGMSLFVQQSKLRGKYDALIGDATTNENLQLWKFNTPASENKSLMNKLFSND